MHKAAQAYVHTQVTTTNQGDLLLLLYDGAIKFLKQARERIEARDYAQKGILISKALDVISELDGCLNSQKGGDLAENLHKLYFYCNAKLLQANLKLDTKYLDEVVTILTGLRDAFAEVSNTPEAIQAQNETVHAAGRQAPETQTPKAQPQMAPAESAPQGVYGPSAPARLSAVPTPGSGPEPGFDSCATRRMNGANAYRRAAQHSDS